jgi:hypothetical protein
MKPMDGMPDQVGMAFSRSDRTAVMETFAEAAYLLCLPLYRYQSRKILDYDPSAWSRVEIAASSFSAAYIRKTGDVNEQWWRDSFPPEPVMDDNNTLVGTLLELSRLRTEGFVAEAGEKDDTAAAEQLEEFGLDRPAITAIVYTSKEEGTGGSEKLFALAIGTQAGPDEQTRYARLNGSGPVFLVPDRLARALEREYR